MFKTSTIICGYIALILVGLLSSSPASRDETLGELPNGNPRDKVEALISRLHELERMLSHATRVMLGRQDAGDRQGETVVLGWAVDEAEKLLHSVST